MADGVITNVDNGSVLLGGRGVWRNELVTFGGADTFVEGTILARREVTKTPTAQADGDNTGDGTVTALSVVDGPVVPLVGGYTLECVAAETNGGTFKLVDPNGAKVATDLKMTAGAGASTVFEVAGLQFTVTDGDADFAVGDKFTITVAKDGKFVPFNPGGAAGEQIARSVLTSDLVATGAGDVPAEVLVDGMVDENRLVIDADGDGSNITAVILDQLRANGITAKPVQQLGQKDNQ